MIFFFEVISYYLLLGHKPKFLQCEEKVKLPHIMKTCKIENCFQQADTFDFSSASGEKKIETFFIWPKKIGVPPSKKKLKVEEVQKQLASVGS